MIDESLKSLASQGANFGVLTTLMPDGSFQSQVIWVDADDDHVLINTEIDRQKHRNVQREPRVTITVIDSANPYHYIEARGRVVGEVTGEVARKHIDDLSIRYTKQPYDPAAIGTERVILQILPEKLHRNG
ncbi:MAG TPA: PPOX class F420-dependent oxidoreductase [Microthrixaceae bacterium]|nr:PPOX class F420-dependent oxidoreductase [Microthrixaceae bacterium]